MKRYVPAQRHSLSLIDLVVNDVAANPALGGFTSL
jgi:hypothetical protein